ncbi:enoyl-CoA hydratase-related protein [Aromatoleum petrolei]|uniref:Enoyl-CoA hydratase n=1 Tax=Aromatoleum petrolei TaxID=76116 RepID=A0ABX1MGF5_9RHOO|nr:enoyl-CoA hydratase-related protein [Aromatoleum petrolei]NMF87017.1 enoyl-CoA hydratase [Aromatoleum petrolei]QTQ34751.1 Enoyl-CoA hydratase/isomerase [Aromatoleum petrolei]
MSAPPLHFHDVAYRNEGEVALIALENPPVNSLGHGVRRGLVDAFDKTRRDPQVRAIVRCGRGRGFSAGGDIHELGTPAATAEPALSLHVHPVIENSEKPVVAAIHGLAIGGGLETALVCHYRIAAGDAMAGLPELKLGVIPLSGTQRLPRALGLEKAIDVILGGELRPARQLADGALFDRVIEGDAQTVLSAAIAFARGRVGVLPLPLIRQRSLPDADPAAVVAAARARLAADEADNPMAREALNAIAAAAETPDFDAGMAVARTIYDRLVASDEVRR